eukprot:2668966-Pleurochrysis_carterae.AAC.2
MAAFPTAPACTADVARGDGPGATACSLPPGAGGVRASYLFHGLLTEVRRAKEGGFYSLMVLRLERREETRETAREGIARGGNEQASASVSPICLARLPWIKSCKRKSASVRDASL